MLFSSHHLSQAAYSVPTQLPSHLVKQIDCPHPTQAQALLGTLLLNDPLPSMAQFWLLEWITARGMQTCGDTQANHPKQGGFILLAPTQLRLHVCLPSQQLSFKMQSVLCLPPGLLSVSNPLSRPYIPPSPLDLLIRCRQLPPQPTDHLPLRTGSPAALTQPVSPSS